MQEPIDQSAHPSALFHLPKSKLPPGSNSNSKSNSCIAFVDNLTECLYEITASKASKHPEILF